MNPILIIGGAWLLAQALSKKSTVASQLPAAPQSNPPRTPTSVQLAATAPILSAKAIIGTQVLPAANVLQTGASNPTTVQLTTAVEAGLAASGGIAQLIATTLVASLMGPYGWVVSALEFLGDVVVFLYTFAAWKSPASKYLDYAAQGGYAFLNDSLRNVIFSAETAIFNNMVSGLQTMKLADGSQPLANLSWVKYQAALQTGCAPGNSICTCDESPANASSFCSMINSGVSYDSMYNGDPLGYIDVIWLTTNAVAAAPLPGLLPANAPAPAPPTFVPLTSAQLLASSAKASANQVYDPTGKQQASLLAATGSQLSGLRFRQFGRMGRSPFGAISTSTSSSTTTMSAAAPMDLLTRFYTLARALAIQKAYYFNHTLFTFFSSQGMSTAAIGLAGIAYDDATFWATVPSLYSPTTPVKTFVTPSSIPPTTYVSVSASYGSPSSHYAAGVLTPLTMPAMDLATTINTIGSDPTGQLLLALIKFAGASQGAAFCAAYGWGSDDASLFLSKTGLNSLNWCVGGAGAWLIDPATGLGMNPVASRNQDTLVSGCWPSKPSCNPIPSGCAS